MTKLNGIIYRLSEQRDLNPRLPSPQDGTLPNCAMPRYNDQYYIDSIKSIEWKTPKYANLLTICHIYPYNVEYQQASRHGEIGRHAALRKQC